MLCRYFLQSWNGSRSFGSCSKFRFRSTPTPHQFLPPTQYCPIQMRRDLFVKMVPCSCVAVGLRVRGKLWWKGVRKWKLKRGDGLGACSTDFFLLGIYDLTRWTFDSASPLISVYYLLSLSSPVSSQGIFVGPLSVRPRSNLEEAISKRIISA